jgi:hypothetical protein
VLRAAFASLTRNQITKRTQRRGEREESAKKKLLGIMRSADSRGMAAFLHPTQRAGSPCHMDSSLFFAFPLGVFAPSRSPPSLLLLKKQDVAPLRCGCAGEMNGVGGALLHLRRMRTTTTMTMINPSDPPPIQMTSASMGKTGITAPVLNNDEVLIRENGLNWTV